jgi:hypothetical protein
MSGLRLATYGTGRLITEALRQLPPTGHQVALGVVHSPERGGKDLGELTLGHPLGIVTTADLAGGLAGTSVDLLLYGGLWGPAHEHVMQQCAEAGVDVVHTCFAHPRVGLEPDVRERLDSSARASGARILGTGILPGLLLDVLPAALASGLPDPVTVTAGVVSDLTSWGPDVLRHELGVGEAKQGTAVRYDAIMRESAYQLADAFGVEFTELRSVGGLVLAEVAGEIATIPVAPGQVEGFDQRVIGVVGSETLVDLAWIAVPTPRARGLREGLELTLTGGDGGTARVRLTWTGDPYPGTAARMLKTIGPLRRLPAGVHLPAALAIA